ncbi:Uncharacterised protein [BD1-7 clade bacterium]|uniref:Uncharacterized protein n=1 Tax=BD1-7 clade bacterium TaxID=2029982 RepID=A0A5S9QS09_9GAMM|nr:Uncharacterised protein [BD1-7 clade bacterium]
MCQNPAFAVIGSFVFENPAIKAYAYHANSQASPQPLASSTSICGRYPPTLRYRFAGCYSHYGYFFSIALFTTGFTHDLLLEAAVFLVSVKLILMAYNTSVINRELQSRLDSVLDRLDALDQKLDRAFDFEQTDSAERQSAEHVSNNDAKERKNRV